MFMTLALAAALAAPVPAAPPPSPATGSAPRLLDVKASDGKVTVPVRRPPPGGAVVVRAVGNPNGGVILLEQEGGAPQEVPLEDLKELTVTTADGKKVDVAEAAKRLAKGGVVLVSTDGKKVDPAYLRAVRDDVLVLVSPELVVPAGARPE